MIACPFCILIFDNAAMDESASSSRAKPPRRRKSAGGKLDPRLVLHPVHLRILTAVQRRPLTTAQLAAEFPTIAQATLYRHISRLVAGGALIVSDERWVHGARERTYTVPPQGAYISREKLSRPPKREIISFFNQFLTLLSDGFARHVESPAKGKLHPNQVRFFVENLHLTGAERAALLDDICNLIERAARLPAGPGRQRQTLAHVSFPSP